MKHAVIKIQIVLMIIATSLSVFASDQHADQQMVQIDQHIAEKSKIETSVASPGTINEQLKIYGRTVNDPSQVSHIRARFVGKIIQVNADIGDKVNVGDVLAYVESNDSLRQYRIKALTPGVVVARHANPGEMALDQVLFTVANFEKIWAELQVFPGQMKYIKSGQNVVITGSDNSVETEIKHIIPSQNEQPYAIARVLINNPTHEWTTGFLVSAQVAINHLQADLVVPDKAIQFIDNRPVVFVKNGQTYSARTVETGRTDGRFTEILSGLRVGDEYVSENSYLIKADIEKSGASHDH